MSNKIEYPYGTLFGGIIYLHEVANLSRRKALFKCHCGNEFIASVSKVKTGYTKSCGCLQKKIRAELSRTHGQTSSRLYTIWKGIKARCYNSHTNRYHRYGGRGVHMCDEWRKSPESFMLWGMTNGYSDELQIDRIDNDGNYEPNNCQWVTPLYNSRKKSTVKLNISLVNEIRDLRRYKIFTVTELAEHYNISKTNIYDIIHNKIWKS